MGLDNILVKFNHLRLKWFASSILSTKYSKDELKELVSLGHEAIQLNPEKAKKYASIIEFAKKYL